MRSLYSTVIDDNTVTYVVEAPHLARVRNRDAPILEVTPLAEPDDSITGVGVVGGIDERDAPVAGE